MDSNPSIRDIIEEVKRLHGLPSENVFLFDSSDVVHTYNGENIILVSTSVARTVRLPTPSGSTVRLVIHDLNGGGSSITVETFGGSKLDGRLNRKLVFAASRGSIELTWSAVYGWLTVNHRRSLAQENIGGNVNQSRLPGIAIFPNTIRGDISCPSGFNGLMMRPTIEAGAKVTVQEGAKLSIL
jgi:hypothetical protein